MLDKEISWFNQVLDARIATYFKHEGVHEPVESITPPDPHGMTGKYASTIVEHNFNFQERLIIILALIPHLQPHLLDTFFVHNKNFDRPFTEFGGWKGKMHGGFLPTCETALFILAGDCFNTRLEVSSLLNKGSRLHRLGILTIDYADSNEPASSAALAITEEYLSLFIYNEQHKISCSAAFPARKITTNLDWSDLVLEEQVLNEVQKIITWIKNEKEILNKWNFKKFIKPGFRSLFYGASGTGKTLTVSLIGKSLDIDVYRVDLSMVVSKYIGETEKNLSKIFDVAESRNWILFFDEADALFSKRTQTSSSNDRHANQEVAYLLQRIEEYDGVVILATNLKSNIDDAFARRFQSLIHFSMPEPNLRKKLWNNMLDTKVCCDDDVDLNRLSKMYELSGGAMINVIRFASIQVFQRGAEKISMNDLVYGIKKELQKEGRTV